MHAHMFVAKTVRDFCSAQHMILLPWPAYSLDMSPIKLVWDLVGRRLAHDSCPAASKTNFCCTLQATWNSLLQADIQNIFVPMSRREATLIVARSGYTKY
ncbi:hypothetical protein TNCV_2799701 [Trichonephila clavipes]|nr:hypothetical protein TNCV_2799701 [Trichonephila clavipes]